MTKTITTGYVDRCIVRAVKYSGRDSGLNHYKIIKGDFFTNIHDKVPKGSMMGTVKFDSIIKKEIIEI